jgi:hypothetical protein
LQDAAQHRWLGGVLFFGSGSQQMRASSTTRFVGVLVASAIAGSVLVLAGQQQGVGQTPSSLPLSSSIRERGSSVTGALEGWYYAKDGSQNILIGYFNRNLKEEFDIPVGPNNRVEPGGPDQGQPTHFLTGRQWGVFTIKVPKDFGTKKFTWTIVANGQTNVITLHTHADYIVEPLEDPANKNTPPVVTFQPGGPTFTGPPVGIAATYSATLPDPLTLTVWATDEGPKINVPEPSTGRGRGRGRGTPADAPDAAGAAAGAPAGAAGRGGRGRGGFTPPPPLALTWTVQRGPGAVTFDPPKPPIDKADGKATTTATFTVPGEYILRLQANDSTGDGGAGFQCCWTNTHVKVTVKPAATGG